MGRATRRSSSSSMARQNIRRFGSDIKSPVNKCSVENVYAEEIYDIQEKKNEPGKFTKIRNPSSSNPLHFTNTICPKKRGSEDSFWFEEEYISAHRDSGFNSFCRTSGGKKHASAGRKLFTENPFGECPLPEPHTTGKSSFERSKRNVPHKFFPSGNFSSEKHTFCQPYSRHVHSHEPPIVSTIEPGRRKPYSYMDSKVEGRPRDLFPFEGSQGYAEIFHVSVDGNVAKDGSESQQTECIEVKLQKDICIGSNNLSSENEQPSETSDSKNNCSECKEATKFTPEMENQKSSGSPEHAEEMSSSVKIPDKFDDSTEEEKYHIDSLPRQNKTIGSPGMKPEILFEDLEIDDSAPKEKKLESRGGNTSLDPSCQVTMLESYVLQLLCVQKVLKEASGHHRVKKV
ncbi:hypothetical protein U1Q18_020656 [Sarracenia purpurea var. burkii]